jgi:predicted RecB family nuclease
MNKKASIKELSTIPGVGNSIANDLWNINIKRISDLENLSPEYIYNLSNQRAGRVQDRCLLYVFRCAIYFINTPKKLQESDKLKWWNWKD